MNESLLIFSREWVMTTALTAYLAPSYSRPVTPVYGLVQLARLLREQPRPPVVLGLRPHEHVAERYGFCTWDIMHDPFSRWMDLRRFRQFAADTTENGCVSENIIWPAPVASAMTEIQILERANRWLYRALSASGLTRYEFRILSLLAGGSKGRLPCQTRSLHKNNGLYKLGMTKRLMDLYRGVKVRPELQAGLPQQAEERVTEHDGLFRQEAGW
ncbi:hypothetical protein ACQUWL_28085 [Serratia marcescens]|uniref:hypothetical protein n=1 Tax=Serratia marcescens TaxID=615 RepID=UPI003D183BD4